MTKKVIVYGATDAIGTSLIETISRKQPEWTVLAASRSGGDKSYLPAGLKLAKFELVKGDA